ncbi:hypothetical protein IQ241_15635 [Romeria aff. gracilis LEGE 07310]|uniref:Uncharacterized protein n=1 Tax=Vasconcelosia minhoensis LEGE 07310 TaxID=915328 RepID=A0A8J7DRJ8_9CYAN|nr:hypothetical protein [Romeria gracilis]MBE9078709.1 hypothetical protein [Romeria aff. gracilis LEGE 07310]
MGLALAFQLLLTNLGIALGLTLLKLTPQPSAPIAESHRESQSKAAGSKVGLLAGLGGLLTVNTVLFASCFLAVKFSALRGALAGAALGSMIWSAYLLLLVWVSSTAIGSLFDTLLGAVAKLFRNLLGGLKSAISPDPSDSAELSSLNEAVGSQLQATLAALESSRQLLAAQTAELSSAPSHEAVSPDIVQYNQLIDVLKAATSNPGSLNSPNDPLNHPSVSPSSGPSIEADDAPATSPSSGLFSRLRQLDASALMQTALNRLDLSEEDIKTLWQQTQQFVAESRSSESSNDASEETASAQTADFSMVRLELENYLTTLPADRFQPAEFEAEFRDLLYDPEAEPMAVQAQLAELDSADFATILAQRQDIAPVQQRQIVGRLTNVYKDVLDVLEADTAAAKMDLTDEIATLQDKLATYFLYTNTDKLTVEAIQPKLESLIENSDRPLAHWQAQSPSLDLGSIEAILQRRSRLKPNQSAALLAELQSAWQRLIGEESAADESLSQTVANTIQQFFSDLEGPLSIEDVKPRLLTFLGSALSGIGRQADKVDWGSVAQQLRPSLKLPDKEIESLVHWLAERWPQPRRWSVRKALRQAKTQTQSAVSQAMSQGKSVIEAIPADLNGASDPPDLQLFQLTQQLEALLDQAETGLADLGKTLRSAARYSNFDQMAGQALDTLRHRLQALNPEHWTEQLPDSVSLPEFFEPLKQRLESTQRRLSDQIEEIQAQALAEARSLRLAAQQRADRVRRQVATAAWWVFVIGLTSGLSSAIAGGLASADLSQWPNLLALWSTMVSPQ